MKDHALRDSSVPERPARVVSGAAPKLVPLYPARCVVPRETVAAWRELEEIRAEAGHEREIAAAILQRARDEARQFTRKRRSRLQRVTSARRLAANEAERSVVKRAIAYLRRLDQNIKAAIAGQDAEGELERAVEPLAVTLAGLLVQVEISERPRQLIGIAGRALREARSYQRLRLLVHPLDLVLIQDARECLMEQLLQGQDLVIDADPAIERPGVRVETEGGEYSLIVAERFRALLASLDAQVQA